MRALKSTPAYLILFFGVVCTEGQGTFQNLDFESATPGSTSPNTVAFQAALPGWTGYIAGVPQTTAGYNLVALDSSTIGVIDRGWSSWMGSAGVIEGHYTAILQAGLGISSGVPADTAMSQTGLVPAGAQSLFFQAYAPGYLSPLLPLNVTLGGQRLSYVALASGTNYTLYGADIHNLAGQVAELDFTVPAMNPHYLNNTLVLGLKG